MNILLKNAHIWTERRVADVAVNNGSMSFPADPAPTAFDSVVDLGGRIVLPGFADSHMHLDKALIAEKVGNRSGTLGEAIEIMQPYKAAMTDADIRDRAERALLMCFANGSRFLRTHVDVGEAIGLRSFNVLKELQARYRDRLLLQIVAFPQEGIANPGDRAALEAALAEGADCVGGIPAFDPDPAAHIAAVLDMAAKHGIPADLHIDETDDPASLTLETLAEMTMERGLQGKVAADHCCSLAANPPEIADRVLEKAARAGIAIISLPSTNLYLQGREDTINVRRGIAPLKRILAHGITAAVGSDNMQDPFNPFGNGSLLLQALIAGHGCHMGGLADFDALFDMITVNPLRIMDVTDTPDGNRGRGVIVLDAKTPREAIVGQCRLFASYGPGASGGNG